jgi:hypothetical protein
VLIFELLPPYDDYLRCATLGGRRDLLFPMLLLLLYLLDYLLLFAEFRMVGGSIGIGFKLLELLDCMLS